MTTRRRRPRAPKPETLSMDWFTDKNPPARGGHLEVPVGYMELGLRCPHCWHGQVEYLRSTAHRPNLLCESCGQLSASGAWGIIYIYYVPPGIQVEAE